jgi:hypothetical protein
MKNDLSSAPDPYPSPREPTDRGSDSRETLDEIHRLMKNPVLYDPLRAPRYPIVLCHGVCPSLDSFGDESKHVGYQACTALMSVDRLHS